MNEFIFEDKTEDIVELIGFSPIKKCYIVVNAELESRYPHITKNPNVVREELLKKAFENGVREIL